MVLTTKHHDGFCLFPSKYTDFSSANMGPQRDITGELTEAVQDEGLRMGLYYSGLIDWQFANDPIFREEENFTNACPTFEYADYSFNQMKELIDRYHPSVLWNDIGWPKQSEHAMPYLLAHYYNTVEDGVEFHFTKKNKDLYVFVDGLKLTVKNCSKDMYMLGFKAEGAL